MASKRPSYIVRILLLGALFLFVIGLVHAQTNQLTLRFPDGTDTGLGATSFENQDSVLDSGQIRSVCTQEGTYSLLFTSHLPDQSTNNFPTLDAHTVNWNTQQYCTPGCTAQNVVFVPELSFCCGAHRARDCGVQTPSTFCGDVSTNAWTLMNRFTNVGDIFEYTCPRASMVTTGSVFIGCGDPSAFVQAVTMNPTQVHLLGRGGVLHDYICAELEPENPDTLRTWIECHGNQDILTRVAGDTADLGVVIQQGVLLAKKLGASETLETGQAFNFNPARGSIELIIKPGWRGNDGLTHTFFSYATDESNFIKIIKQSDSTFSCQYRNGGGNHNPASANVAGWGIGEIHRARMTYDTSTGRVTCTVDGITTEAGGAGGLPGGGTVSLNSARLGAVPGQAEITVKVSENTISSTLYCNRKGRLVNDLDVPLRDTTEQKTCEAAKLTWTGTKCCSEDDDLPNEFYNDPDPRSRAPTSTGATAGGALSGGTVGSGSGSTTGKPGGATEGIAFPTGGAIASLSGLVSARTSFVPMMSSPSSPQTRRGLASISGMQTASLSAGKNDFNSDGKIDEKDLALIDNVIRGTTPVCSPAQCDLNADGRIDLADRNSWIASLSPCPALVIPPAPCPAVAQPDPAACPEGTPVATIGSNGCPTGQVTCDPWKTTSPGTCWNSTYLRNGQNAPGTNDKILTVQGRLLGCQITGTTAASTPPGDPGIFDLKDKHAATQLITEVPACTLAINLFGIEKNNRFCSPQSGNWKQTDLDIPRSLISDPTDVNNKECCPQSTCWNGERCQENQRCDSSLTDTRGFRCIDGAWVGQTPLSTPNRQDRGYCAQDNRCLVNPRGKSENLDKPTTFFSQDPSQQPTCIKQGQFILNNLCQLKPGIAPQPVGTQKTEWKSRASLIALQLADIGEAVAPNSYSVFCSNFEDVLNFVDYDETLGNIRSYLTTPCIINNVEAPCINSFCAMRFGDNKIAFGTSTNVPITDSTKSFLKALGKPSTFCSGAMQEDGAYHACGDGIFYNNITASLIRAPPGISPAGTATVTQLISNRQSASIGAGMKKISDFMATRSTLTKRKPFFDQTTLFSEVFISKGFGRNYFGVLERDQFNESLIDYVGLAYDGFPVVDPVTQKKPCDMIREKIKQDKILENDCEFDTSNNLRYIAFDKSPASGEESPLRTFWRDLTAKLR